MRGSSERYFAMSDTSTSDDVGEQLEERDSVTLTVPLDPAHRRMDLALRENGLNVDETLSEEAAPVVEKLIYDLLQEAKYGDSDE